MAAPSPTEYDLTGFKMVHLGFAPEDGRVDMRPPYRRHIRQVPERAVAADDKER